MCWRTRLRVGELAAHGGERVEAAGLALVEDDVVDERFEQHQALEVARVGELRVEAGVVEDLSAHGIAQQVVAGLQAGELIGVAARIRMHALGGLAIGGLHRAIVGIAL